MSRWVDSFENHPFQAVWSNIIKVAEEIIVDDATIVTSVEEITRLKKVVSFLKELLLSCDPELIPESTWVSFHSQSDACLQQINQYQNNRNIGHITNANANLDNLLTYIRPYQVVAGKAAKSASTAFSAYTKTISTYLSSFQSEAGSLLTEIVDLKSQAIDNANKLQDIHRRIKDLDTSFFDDTDSESLSTRMVNFESHQEKSYEKINRLRAELLEGDPDSESISTVIKNALETAESESESINELLNEVQVKVSDFKNYHTIVFGKKNGNGELEGGLKDEISVRKNNLDEFKNKQELRYKALTDEIESLLPGATSAGLATAYYDLKESFNKPIKNYSSLFYYSIACLMLVAFVSMTQEIGWFFIKFVDVSDLSKLVPTVLYKLPIILPILWLALFASKRRSEALRLQQEYSHKEALAKSYQNFKAQIEALNQPDPELMRKLLNAAIDAVSMNASDTLDKNHGDNTPVTQGVDGLIESMEKLKKVF